MLPLALQGFGDAHSRHRDLRLTSDPASLFVSAAECVYWAATIDEQLRQRPEYAEFTADHVLGSLLPGVRYVRNLKTHSLPMTMQSVEGLMFPIVFPTVFNEVVWLPLDRLPEPNRTTNAGSIPSHIVESYSGISKPQLPDVLKSNAGREGQPPAARDLFIVRALVRRFRTFRAPR